MDILHENKEGPTLMNSMPKRCKRLPRDASRQEILDAHKVKMASKKIINDSNSKRYADTSPILANISKNHEHWGDSPREHEARKNSS